MAPRSVESRRRGTSGERKGEPEWTGERTGPDRTGKRGIANRHSPTDGPRKKTSKKKRGKQEGRKEGRNERRRQGKERKGEDAHEEVEHLLLAELERRMGLGEALESGQLVRCEQREREREAVAAELGELLVVVLERADD